MRIRLVLLFSVLVLHASAQTSDYRYKAKLQNVSKNWHNLEIPNAAFSKMQTGLEDLRIFGFKGKDTVTVPYLLEKSKNQVTEKEIAFNLINESNTKDGYYFTFQMTSAALINQIRFAFQQANFDWKINLEGSNDNNQWFNIISNYRILSIKNEQTAYQFTQLNFPNSKYNYFRILIKANEQPTIQHAKILKIDTLKAMSRPMPVKTYHLENHIDTKETVIEVGLNELSPLSSVMLNVQSKFDYYRPVTIEYATDTIKTEKGIHYQYTNVYTGTLSVMEQPEFKLNGILALRLRITIQNDDNPPLQFSTTQVKSAVYELVARFDQIDYQYALYYGNEKVSAPIYDLKNFENKIPTAITPLTVESPGMNPAFTPAKPSQPLFENKAWLWALMGLIISILGFFTYRMLKGK